MKFLYDIKLLQQEINAHPDWNIRPEMKPVRMLPGVTVVKIGGQSIMDRGAAAVLPLLEELVENVKDHPMVVITGGGTRSRHAYGIGIGLKMPVGVIAKLGTAVSKQNAHMVQMLLAEHGGIYVDSDDYSKLPLYLKSGCIPITPGMPAFEFWTEPPETGQVPECRTDAGTLLFAETFGADRVIYFKDEDGLYTKNPKKDPNGTFIPKISVDELIEMDLDDLVVERVVLSFLKETTYIDKVQIINCLKRGNMTRALNGEPVGTIISKS